MPRLRSRPGRGSPAGRPLPAAQRRDLLRDLQDGAVRVDPVVALRIALAPATKTALELGLVERQRPRGILPRPPPERLRRDVQLEGCRRLLEELPAVLVEKG